MGERFGKYELRRRIGTGGMAEVFVAETHGAEGFHKPVVIKRILPAFNQDPDFVRMFINEAHLAARLQHTNIVQIFDFDHVGDTYYIAMEWVDGADLRRLRATSERRRRPMPQRLAVHVGVETLKGLHYAHTLAERGRPLGFVHRDISPHNLLVSFAGEVKIADFGIAKAAAFASATKTGVVKGKLPYMAPEQIEAGAVDQRSDIFSLGLVLWELLRGQRPYGDAESEGELLGAVRRGVVPRLAEVGELPGELAAVVDRMTAREPERRYQSAAAALEQLARLATVDDGLALADYLRQLMPAEGERQLRGATAVVAQEPFEEATAGAETRTRPSTADLREGLAPSEPPGEEPPGEEPPPPGDEPPECELLGQGLPGDELDDPPAAERSSGAGPGSALSLESAGGRPRRAPMIVALAALTVVVGGLGWLVGAGERPERPHGGAAALTPMAKLSIGTEPSGAKLWVDGVELHGVSPQVIEARPGQRLALRARRDGLEASREVVVGARGGQVSMAMTRSVQEPKPSQSKVSQSKATQSKVSQSKPKARPGRAVRRGVAGGAKGGPIENVSRRPVSSGSRKGFGKLHVVVAPWAFVRLDGQRLGSTPVRALRLKAGHHRLELTNPELGRRERLKLRISGGQSTTIRRNWSK